MACLASAARGARGAEGERSRILVAGGGAFDHRPHEGADFFSVAVARDYAFSRGSHFAFALELYPLVLFRQETGTSDERELNPAVAAGGLITFRGTGPGGRWGYRLEVGPGIIYAPRRSVPAGGTRINFYDQGGLSLSWNRKSGPAVSVGYRWNHISNLSLFPDKANPGIDFHAVVVGLEWLR